MPNLNSGRGIVDSAQIMPYIYDTKEEAIRVLPAGGSGFSIELSAADGDSVKTQPDVIDTTTLLENVDAGVSHNSIAVNILNYKNYSVMCYWSEINGLDSRIHLQASLDDKHWDDILGESRVLSCVSGTHLFNISNAQYKYFRLCYNNNGNTTGIISAQYVVKG